MREVHGKIGGRQIIQWLFFAFVVTCSFDIVLSVEIATFHVRIGMVFLGLAEFLGFFYVLSKGQALIPSGGVILLILLVINGLFCFHSPDWKDAVGYELWFIMLVGAAFLACNIFKSETDKAVLTQVFLWQFVLMALVGYVQFVGGLFGYSFFTMQWTKLYVPRLNGFNYEPSYYASFLMIAWVFLAYLFERRDTSFLPPKWCGVLLATVSGAIILSTSRMGWLLLVLWCGFRLVFCLFRDRAAIKQLAIIVAILLAFLFIIVSITNLEKPLVEEVKGLWESILPAEPVEPVEPVKPVDPVKPVEPDDTVTPPPEIPSYMYNGQETGSFSERYLEGSLVSSSNTRFTSMKTLFKVFFGSPLIGYSLGGVLSASIEQYPDIILSLEQPNAGLTAEMLAAFGVFGFLLVMVYLVIMLKASVKTSAEERSCVVRAWMWALIWELGILQFNNNILRLYVWALVAILSAYLPCKSISIRRRTK